MQPRKSNDEQCSAQYRYPGCTIAALSAVYAGLPMRAATGYETESDVEKAITLHTWACS